ncbi:hypothetical protein BGX27_010629 [Mortierella sp. AM989]|nr:hypothetical protein BGX27_010629 [Mortierella sp. AM989]
MVRKLPRIAVQVQQGQAQGQDTAPAQFVSKELPGFISVTTIPTSEANPALPATATVIVAIVLWVGATNVIGAVSTARGSAKRKADENNQDQGLVPGYPIISSLKKDHTTDDDNGAV